MGVPGLGLAVGIYTDKRLIGISTGIGYRNTTSSWVKAPFHRNRSAGHYSHSAHRRLSSIRS